jgi:hypothetical protein
MNDARCPDAFNWGFFTVISPQFKVIFHQKGKGKVKVTTVSAYAMKVYGGVEVYYTDPHSFISALDAHEWSFSRPGRLSVRKIPPTIDCIGGLSVPQFSVPWTGNYMDYL